MNVNMGRNKMAALLANQWATVQEIKKYRLGIIRLNRERFFLCTVWGTASRIGFSLEERPI